MSSNSFVFIVNKETYETHIKYGFCAIGKANKEAFSLESFNNPSFQASQHSLLADILNIQVGDTVFFYVSKEGFKGVYEVTQSAFFDPTPIGCVPASRPFRILIKPKHAFSQPVPENALFSTPERQQIFWLWYFNKMRTYPRGCTPMDPDAKKKLIELLIKHNNGEMAALPSSLPYTNQQHLHEIRSLAIPTRKSALQYEDSLRALLMKALQEKSVVVTHLLGGADTIEWYANQVPYNISGNNIDMLLYHRSKPIDGVEARYKITVVELKKDKAGIEEFYQLMGYCQWAGDQLADREHYLIQPVLIASEFDERLYRLIEDFRPTCKMPLLIQYHYQEQKLTLEIVKPRTTESPVLPSSPEPALAPEVKDRFARLSRLKPSLKRPSKKRNIEIQARLQAGESLATVAKAYGLSKARISQISKSS